MTADGSLSGLLVLDMTGRMGNYAGKMFAELGADVILVEEPSGNELRRSPPFAHDRIDDTSLAFEYHNTSKRGICLDLTTPGGRDVLRSLAGHGDLVLEDRRPGELKKQGLDPSALTADHPGLVWTSITPFGQTGPYADFEHSDLVCLALGGLLSLGGYSDGPPVMAAGEQAYVAGNLYAAVASMIAITHAELTGTGQWVDVSVQESVTMALENAAQTYDLEGRVRRRFGGTQRQAGFGVFPCKDGEVFLLAGGIGGNRFWPNLVDWMDDDGVAGVGDLRDPAWGETDFLLTEDAQSRFWELFVGFASNKKMANLYHDAQRWRVPLCPINRPTDVVESAQLTAREFFVDVNILDRTAKMPGAPYKLSETPWRLSRPAPKLGEHTDEVLAQHGFDADNRERLRREGAIR